MTNARPPWQRGRRKPTKDRRRKKERPELGFQARTRWPVTEARVGAGREKEIEIERKKEREREIKRIQGENEGKKANALVQRPCRLVRAPPPLTLEFIHPHKFLLRPRSPASSRSPYSPSRSYLIDDHPRDRSSGRERTTALRGASEMSEV